MKELFACLMLVFPFLFVGALARELVRQTNDKRYALRFFLFSAAVLAGNWLWGHVKSEGYMAQQMWTAATFSYAAIVLRSVPITLACWVIKERLVRRTSTRAEPPVED